MRLGWLKRSIESVPPIPSPDPGLEQYTTPAELALSIAGHALHSGLLQGSTVADLGAGTCRLAAALLLLGAGRVVAVDADPRLAPICLDALERLGVGGRLAYIISRVTGHRGPLAPCSVDLVASNPPFGVHRRGADWEVLLHALEAARLRVYAILKSGNIDYHRRAAARMGYRVRLLESRPFPIPASMRHHVSRIRRVMVDVVLFEREGGCTG
ncbi:MAG: METTL5 family protein [Desulfurococcales archaeon]|nr:METTL5 family protein [Desulfurococcales archaeon]